MRRGNILLLQSGGSECIVSDRDLGALEGRMVYYRHGRRKRTERDELRGIGPADDE